MPARWTCEVCQRSFGRKGDLKRHEKLHTGEKPHVCMDCGKAFAQFTGLKTHRNVHTGAKPHSCNLCGARFGDPSSCARHKRETHTHPEGYICPANGCTTKIKRRSAFVKHLKSKHDIDVDLTRMSIEEAATTVESTRASPDAERMLTPPPDYGTATNQPMYQEEDLPSFCSGAMPKEEVHTPPSVDTPPPAVIDVVPSSEGYKWSSAGFVDHAVLGAGVVCGSPDPALLSDLQSHTELPMLDMNCFFYPDAISQQPPSYYEQQWSGTPFAPSPIPLGSVASVDIFNSSPSPCASGTDYNFTYDPNTCGDFNSQMSSLRDATDMHAYMTAAPMPSFSPYSFA